MKRLALLAFAAFAASSFWWSGGPAPSEAADADPGTTAPVQKRPDTFDHAEPAHKKQSCASCHKAPTSNWASQRAYPDVADYPAHAACFNCHQKDIFSGNQPKFCAVCHVNPGPRGVARFPFPDKDTPTEFKTVFPHNIHQDVIASHQTPRTASGAMFLRAGFRPADDPVEFNNCAICHETSKDLPRVAPRGLLRPQAPLADVEKDAFAPKAAFFKTNPTSHAACFQCHYQNAKPVRTDCAGCHQLTEKHREEPALARYSVKFDHQYKDHVNKDCTTCHVRITQTADLASLKGADVPIMTCSTSSCHGNHLSQELGKRSRSVSEKQPVFQCVYCHSPEIGRYPVPGSHKPR